MFVVDRCAMTMMMEAGGRGDEWKRRKSCDPPRHSQQQQRRSGCGRKRPRENASTHSRCRFVVSLWLVLVVVVTGEDAPNDTAASPCAIPFPDALWTRDPGSPLYLFRPSYVEACVSSIAVNQTLMTNHITNLFETFRQYYCFYNVAKDAAASNPKNHQAYPLFSGPLEGQFDLDAALQTLLGNVLHNSTLATFWDVQTAFNQLYDAHVTLPVLTGVAGQVAGFHMLQVLPERNRHASTRRVVQDVQHYYERNELKLQITWADERTNQTTTDVVATLNGRTPYDFYLHLISQPEAARNYPYQSVGARMNGAFRRSKPGGFSVFTFGSWSRPTGILPETFVVTYESGEEEVYYSGIEFDSNNATAIYQLLNSNPDVNQAGSAFSNFAIAIGSVRSSSAVKHLVATPKTIQRLEQPDTKQQQQRSTTEDDYYEWDQIVTLPVGYTRERRDVAAYKIAQDDNYAVLKIQSFDFSTDDAGNPAMIEIWSNFTAAAKAKGVTKAIIDISRNGGGVIVSGNQLAVSMYPHVPYSLFQNQFDITYNDVMLAFHEKVAPVLLTIRRQTALASDAQLQQYLDNAPNNSTIDQLNTAILALFEFCCAGETQPCQDPTCQELANLGIALDTLKNFPSGPQLRTVINELIAAFEQYNPFNVLGTLEEGDVDPDQIYPVNRGGVQQNVTNKFTVLSEPEYFETVSRSFQNQFEFEEYTLVSDGQAGSTTTMFSSFIMQLWNNQDQIWNGDLPPTPLTTITYGGTREPPTVAGFPASVQNVKIEIPIITSGLLYMLEMVLPADIAQSLSGVNEYYQSFLPIPPYFADGLPSMPVYNYYSNWMQPGALPLQYVKMNAEKHIPQTFNSNSISDSSDLAALYSQAAKLGFSSSSSESMPQEDSKDESLVDLEQYEYSFDIATTTSRKKGND